MKNCWFQIDLSLIVYCINWSKSSKSCVKVFGKAGETKGAIQFGGENGIMRKTLTEADGVQKKIRTESGIDGESRGIGRRDAGVG